VGDELIGLLALARSPELSQSTTGPAVLLRLAKSRQFGLAGFGSLLDRLEPHRQAGCLPVRAPLRRLHLSTQAERGSLATD
jgi:hypothetical protein